jgi:flavin-dependent dehydrogenase
MELMETCDVLIVGGGPAGSTCAWKLRQAGLDVVILDKSQFPRHKICAGWITPQVLDELQLDAADYQRQNVMQPITRFITGLINGPEVETTYRRPVSYGIRRCEFDDYLLRRANARLRLGQTFRSLQSDGTNWVVNDELRAPIVIGAGGHFCPVARMVRNSDDAEAQGQPARAPGIRMREQPTVVAQEVEFEMTEAHQQACSVQSDRPELFFCADLLGYGWIFRKENYINIGLGREGEAHLSTHVDHFVRSLAARGKIPANLPDRFHGHAYRLRTVLPRTDAPEGVLLIGDAAGLADRQSGEGIRPAIESGLLAASCILELGDQKRSDLHELYARKLRERFPINSSGSLAAWIPPSARLVAARWLMSSRWFSRRVVLDSWFLQSTQPPLVI